MKISKKQLITLIENFLLEDDDWLGNDDIPDVDISTNNDLEKDEAESKRMANLAKNGVKDFLKLYQSKINKQVKPIGKIVKEYYKSKKFSKILSKPLYASALKKQNITAEKFISDIVDQIEKSQVKITDSYKDKSTLGTLVYGKKELRLYKKKGEGLKFGKDIAMMYDDRIKLKPILYIFIESIFQGVATDKGELYWYRLQDKELFSKAYKQILETIEHEMLHIGNLHQVDLLAVNQEKNDFFEKIGKYFLTEEDLFSNDKRNRQTNASDQDNNPLNDRRKAIKETLINYLNVKTGRGAIEIMERIQKLKMGNSLLTAMNEWKNYKIDYVSGKEKYEEEILDLFCIINWDKFSVKDIVKDFDEVANLTKSVSSNIA